MQGRGICLRAVVAVALALVGAGAGAQQAPRSNAFNDPFVQATRAIPGCPVAEEPLVTPEEMRSQAHIRAEKGTTCHYYGRCRLPNAYLYDKDIVPRVVRFIDLDSRFANSTIWVLGQRRWVYLKGCVANAEQAQVLEAEVRLIDDVETVVNELMVGTSDVPKYITVPSR
jgi:hypothetical protein